MKLFFLLCYTQTNDTKTRTLECPSPRRDWECVQSCSAACFSPLTIQKALGDLLNDLSSRSRSLQWGFTGLSMSLWDDVWNTTRKSVRGLKRLIKSHLLHSLGSGRGFCLGFGLPYFLFVCFFNPYHLLFPKASRKPGNNFKCTCTNSKLASLGNQQSSSSFRQFHGLCLAQVNVKKQKKMPVSDLSSSNE